MNFTALFHYPVGKSREYSQLREKTTHEYSILSTVLVVCVIVCIPIRNRLIGRGYVPFKRFHILKWLNLALNRVISSNSIWAAPARGMKTLAHFVYLRMEAVVQVTFWTAFFAALALSDTYNGDLIFIAKRLGRLSANCLTPVLFLSIRPSPLPETLYLSLLPIHKWLSRMVILQAVLHTVLYCGFFEKNGTWKKAWKNANLAGWLCLFGYVLIAITSLLRVRNAAYKVFFANHYFWTWTVVFFLQVHVRPVSFTPYTIANVAILTGQILYRWRLTAITASNNDFKVVDVSPNLSYVEFPNHLLKQKAVSPGAHVRLTKWLQNPLVNMAKQLLPNYHPYSLVLLPLDTCQKLIVRRSAFKFTPDQKYVVYGSFDPHLQLIKSRNSPGSFSISRLAVNARKVLLVVGGSAISFALPILRVMNYHGIPVKVVWVTRDYRDVVMLNFFDGYVHGDDFEIFVTGDLAREQFSYGAVDLEVGPEEETDSDVAEESECVDVAIGEDEEEDSEDEEACAINESFRSLSAEPEAANVSFEDEMEDTRSFTTHRTSVSSTNELFVPLLAGQKLTPELQVSKFNETVKKLHLDHRIYRGRPRLNHRYYNWCVNEEDFFTQCLGPVADENDHMVCCRDLPRRNKINNRTRTPDASRVWVVSAGPRALVQNVRLWATDNGLKYHEEAFYA